MSGGGTPAIGRKRLLAPGTLGNALVLLALFAAALSLLPLHDGAPWFDAPRGQRRVCAALALLAYLGFCGWIAWPARPRRRHAVDAGDAGVLVAYASQTGFALQLAQRTAATLADAGTPARLCDLAEVDAATLAAGERILFVVSTTGEGDPPDGALAFVRDVLGTRATLPSLRYAILALGDRAYERYCGFGHRLERWLRQSAATPLFDLVEVDNGDAGALRHWQHQLALLADAPELPDWEAPAYDTWRLHQRNQLNRGSAGGAVFHLVLQPPDGIDAQWQAGDIAEIGPRNAPHAVAGLLDALALDAASPVQADGRADTLGNVLLRAHLPAADDVRGLRAQALADKLAPLPHREYSIASLPRDRGLHLLVRRMQRADGRVGIGSGWLCDHAPQGGDIALRIRANPNFHAPPGSRPLILIGNGTGIAGLRAHLKARIASGARRNWLLFGERNAAHDWFHRDEIMHWQRSGDIARVDAVFSRDHGPHRYVQDALRAAGEHLRTWVGEDAAIYVCGSQQGMAPGVDAVLRDVLGDARLQDMLGDGRYRRDVY